MNDRASHNITVIGGGIAGCLAALELARLGFSVNLVEAREDLMLATSFSNAAREHTGPHYPSDLATGLHSLRQTANFHFLLPDFRRSELGGTQYFIPSSPDDQHVDPQTFIGNLRALQQSYTALLNRYPQLGNIFGPPEQFYHPITDPKSMPEGMCFGVASQDKFIDINTLAASIVHAIEEHPNINVMTNHRVVDIKKGNDGMFRVMCNSEGGGRVDIVTSNQVVNSAWSNATKIDNLLVSREPSVPNTVVDNQFLRLKGFVIASLPPDHTLDASQVILGKDGMTVIPMGGGMVAIVGGDNDFLDTKYTKKGEPDHWWDPLSSNITADNITDHEARSGLSLTQTTSSVLERAMATFRLPPTTQFHSLVLGTIATETPDITQRRTDGFRAISDRVRGYHSAITGKFMNGPTIALQIAQRVERDYSHMTALELAPEFRMSPGEFVRYTADDRQRTKDFSVVRLSHTSVADDFAQRQTRLNSGSLGEVIHSAGNTQDNDAELFGSTGGPLTTNQSPKNTGINNFPGQAKNEGHRR